MSEKNLLVISMSVLNSLTENYYEAAEERFYFRGISQLEAGTKYFLRKLQKEGKELDKIYIVESTLARNSKHNIPSGQNILQTVECEDITLSAVEFYKERISQYIRGEEKQANTVQKVEDRFKKSFEKLQEGVNCFENEKKKAEREGQLIPLTKLYPLQEHFFEVVEMKDEEDKEALYDTILSLCEKIRKIKNTSEDETVINLYLDIQGARRYETFIVNSAVKMLETENIAVKSSVAVDFYGKTNSGHDEIMPKYNNIVDTTLNDRIYEMVAGMNEFIKTGRGDTLREFWNHTQDLMPMQNEREIIECIGKISDSISLCDVGEFDKNLNALQNALNNYEKNQTGNNKLFENIVQDLKEDYKKYRLFSKGHEKTKTTDQIRWCLAKKQYQQALTLLESKIPIDIVNNKILYYKDDEQLMRLVNYFANHPNGIPFYYKNEKKIGDRERKYIKKNGDYEQAFKFVFVKYSFLTDSNSENAIKGGKLKFQFPEDDSSDLAKREPAQGEEQIVELLNLYFDLSKKRNDINHANDKNKDVINRREGLEKELLKFVETYEDYLTKNVSLDYSEIESVDFETEEKEWEELKKTDKKDKNTLDKLMKCLEKDDKSSFYEYLEDDWDANQQAITDYKKLWKALYYLKNSKITYEQFLEEQGEEETNDVLRKLLDFAYEAKDDGKTREKFYEDSFKPELKSNKKEPYMRLIKKISAAIDISKNTFRPL